MKAIGMGLVFVLMACWQAEAKFSGFESNINRMITAYKIFIEDVDRGFSRLTFYFDNLDDYATNEELFTVSFIDNLNFTIENLEDSKAAIYDTLETLLSEVYYIHNRRAVYHTKLVEGYDQVVQFIATIDQEDIDPTLRDLFKEFLVKKNLFFYDVNSLKDFMENSVTNIVNTYDMIETFAHDSMRAGETYTKLTVKDVRRFYFVSGFLAQLREYYQNHNEMLEQINKSFLSLEDTLNDLDGYLESLKFYYYRRYVEGYTEDQINNFPQVLFTENVEADDQATEDERDPIDVCDQVLLSNFGIRGLSSAAEVDEFEKIPHCPSIKNSCCSSKELDGLYTAYYDNEFDLLSRKQRLVKGILNKILGSYFHLRDLGYFFLKSSASSDACRETARKVVFTPLSKEFVEKFDIYMSNAQEFVARSRASTICIVCDYDFHKSLEEDKEIKLSKQFCSAMMANYFDFVSVFNMQLVDYFNNVIDLVQCDKSTGLMSKEVLIEFNSNPRLEQVIADCGASREYCESFCEEFKFIDLESDIDLNVDTLRKFYNFLDVQLKEQDVTMAGFIDSDAFGSAGVKYSLERNDLPVKSIDKLKRRFVEDVNDATAHNPFMEGTVLLKVLRQEGEA